ncbi:helix-turn-helix domain-containing protein [Flavitalea antarctica]
MITNFFIPPHPSLSHFIDNYILSTSHGKKITLRSSWPASNETSLVFHLSDQPYHYTSEGELSPLNKERGSIIGLLSHSNGSVSFNGIYHTFVIQFKANGFNKIFRMPVNVFINKQYYLDEVFGKIARDLNESLQNAGTIYLMAELTDRFLLHFLNLRKQSTSLYDGITYVSNELFHHSPLLTVDQYAQKANMSVRNFSRRFAEQTGVSPKFYCRLLRFNTAVNTKLKYPESTWTSIAHECGYFDHMHMIRDFKEFANANPSFQDTSSDMPTEKFVFLKRIQLK